MTHKNAADVWTTHYPVEDEQPISTSLQLLHVEFYVTQLKPALQWVIIGATMAIFAAFTKGFHHQFCLLFYAYIGRQKSVTNIYSSYTSIMRGWVTTRCRVGSFHMTFNHCHLSWLDWLDQSLTHEWQLSSSSPLNFANDIRRLNYNSNHPLRLLPFRFLRRHLEAKRIYQVLGYRMVLPHIPSMNDRGQPHSFIRCEKNYCS